MRRQWYGVAFGASALCVAAAVTWNLGILVALSLPEEPNRTTRANQEMDSGASELRKSRLRDQAARMERALARQASDQAAELKQGAESGTADLRKSLQQERDRASKLERNLATARRDVETQTALAVKTGEEAAQLEQAAESGSAELRQSLQRERDKVAQLERDLALARSKENVVAPSIAATDRINTQSEVAAAKPIAAKQAAVADARADPQSNPEHAAEVARLLARANVLLGRGDIGSARIVLQRPAEMGDAQASFALAETYDPLILAKWGTYGTRGDAKRALDLYAKALAGGIKEAMERSDALRR